MNITMELPDLPTGLPQIFTEENSRINGLGLGIILAGQRFAGDGPVSWRVIVFRGMDQYDPYVVWDVWKEAHTANIPFCDMWHATSGRYTHDLGEAWLAFKGQPAMTRRSPAL